MGYNHRWRKKPEVDPQHILHTTAWIMGMPLETLRVGLRDAVVTSRYCALQYCTTRNCSIMDLEHAITINKGSISVGLKKIRIDLEQNTPRGLFCRRLLERIDTFHDKLRSEMPLTTKLRGEYDPTLPLEFRFKTDWSLLSRTLIGPFKPVSWIKPKTEEVK